MVELKINDKVWFAEEKRPYRVRAVGMRFVICTKPFNPRHTVIYTVVDFQKQIRGTENLIFCMGAETDEQCQEMLARLECDKTEVSQRNQVPLNLIKIESVLEKVRG